MNLTRKEWPLGWFPGNDELNGDPNGLLRADNLELDEKGVLGLVKSYQKINQTQFSGEVVQEYSKFINNTKYRYVVLSNGTILRSSDNFASYVEVITGESFTHVGFTSCLGQNLITCGKSFIKDDGTTIRQLGLLKPDNPPTQITTPVNDIEIGSNFADWSAEYGTIYEQLVGATNVIGIYPAVAGDGVSMWGIAQNIHDYDLSTIGGNPESDDDTFSMWFSRTDQVVSVQLEFLLNSPLYPSTDSFMFRWENPEGTLFGTTGEGTTISVKRREFTRNGVNPNLGWANVHCVKVVVITQGLGAYFYNLKVTSSFLVGKSYRYATMNVANLGTYIAKSPLSEPSDIIAPNGGQIKIQADDPRSGIDADTQINEIWLFRRASEVIDVTPIGSPPILDKWYRVGINTYSGNWTEFLDQFTDEDALELNITANAKYISLKDITEEIIGIISGYYDRVLYLTPKMLYVSEKLNPDSIDINNSIKFEGGDISQNLWITKSSLGVVLIGTTQDIFEVSGTFQNLPDGSIDISVKSLSVSYPPLGYEVDVFSNDIYYVAKDGIRVISPGGSSVLISSPALDLLFQGETRHGIAPVNIEPKSIERYPIAVTQNHVFVSLPFQDGTRNVVDFNLITKTYTFRWTNPISFFVEEDGTVLAGYGAEDSYLREFNTGALVDGTTGQTVRILTIFDDNNQPRNRKDVFTLKVTADAGTCPVKIWVAKDREDFIYLGEYTFNGLTEQIIQLADTIETGKAYALKIEAYWLERFKLYNFTIEYEPFPEQLNYLRIPNNNLGTYSRKRITNYAFVIDTLGNTITFTPYVDGVGLSSSSITFTGKRTFVHYFTSETIGTDIGGILNGGVFEYYGLNLEEIVSEKLPVPVKYLVIPATDYGVPNRKRHSSYKFQINTRGYNVRFTPKLDGVNKTSLTVNTTEKRTVEYFFSQDTIAIDIGGILESLVDEEFEFYGVIKPQEIEVLPARLKEFRIPENNYGIAARKRIRTMPMEINTNGYNVTFTPIIDGVAGTPTTLNSATRQTVFHYFETDVFGVDFSGELIGAQAFEFYGLLKPEDVEVLPVAKKLDQIGPLRFDKIGKLLACRTRLVSQYSGLLPIYFYDEEGINLTTPIYSTNINVTSNQDEIYEFALPKTIKGSTIRIVLGPGTSPFHRYDMQLKVNLAGMDADPKWVKIR